jgi:hypothetical protein
VPIFLTHTPRRRQQRSPASTQASRTRIHASAACPPASVTTVRTPALQRPHARPRTRSHACPPVTARQRLRASSPAPARPPTNHHAPATDSQRLLPASHHAPAAAIAARPPAHHRPRRRLPLPAPRSHDGVPLGPSRSGVAPCDLQGRLVLPTPPHPLRVHHRHRVQEHPRPQRHG